MKGRRVVEGNAISVVPDSVLLVSEDNASCMQTFLQQDSWILYIAIEILGNAKGYFPIINNGPMSKLPYLQKTLEGLDYSDEMLKKEIGIPNGVCTATKSNVYFSPALNIYLKKRVEIEEWGSQKQHAKS